MNISRVDLYMLERRVASNAAINLRTAFKSAIVSSVNAQGESLKSTVRAKYKNRRLDRLTFSAPDYIYKQHYGFEGDKKNGVHMRLKATNVLNKALQSSGVLETLADDIANIRGEEVLTKISFKQNG